MQMLDAVINLKDNFSGTLKVVDQTAKDFQKTMQNTGKDIWQAGKTGEKAGKFLTKNLSAPILGVGVAAGKMAIDFNESMSNIATLIPQQGERLQELKKDIQDISIQTAKSSEEIAQGTYDVISAYGDAEDTMEKVELNAKAATAGLSTTSDALALSSSIMKGFGDTTAESNKKVLDLAFNTVKLGQTSFAELASSMGKVVPTTNELGISQEELFAVFATGTGVTGNASEVSTQYQGVLKSLMSPTKEMTSLMKEMGYQDGKAMIEKMGLAGSIATITQEAEKTGKPLSNYIGSIQGQILALALAGEQSDVYDDKLKELMDSTGALDTAFAEQTEGINKTGFAFKKAMQSMKVAGQNLGDALSPIIETVSVKFTEFADALQNLSPEQLDTIINFAKKAMVIGPAILLISKLTLGVSKLFLKIGDVMEAINKARGVMKLLTGPGAIVVGVITALVVAGVLLYKNWDTVKEKALELKERFSGVGEIAKKLKDRVIVLKDNFIDLKDKAIVKLKEKFSELKEMMVENETAIKNTAGVITALFIPALIKTGVQSVIAGTKMSISFVGSLIKAGAQAVITGGQITANLIGSLIRYAAQGWITVASITATTASWIAQKVAMIASATASGILTAAQWALNAALAANPITIVIGLLVAFGAAMVIAYQKSETFREVVTKAWNGIQSAATTVTGIVMDGWNSVVGVFNTVSTKVESMAGTIKDSWQSVKDFMANPIKGTVNAVKKGAGWVKDKIGNNYRGTDNWRGGPTWVNEKGPEIIDLPSGSRVYPHSKSLDMARNEGRAESQSSGGVKVSVSGNTFHVRKESDIDAVATALARKIAEAGLNTA